MRQDKEIVQVNLNSRLICCHMAQIKCPIFFWKWSVQIYYFDHQYMCIRKPVIHHNFVQTNLHPIIFLGHKILLKQLKLDKVWIWLAVIYAMVLCKHHDLQYSLSFLSKYKVFKRFSWLCAVKNILQLSHYSMHIPHHCYVQLFPLKWYILPLNWYHSPPNYEKILNCFLHHLLLSICLYISTVPCPLLFFFLTSQHKTPFLDHLFHLYCLSHCFIS